MARLVVERGNEKGLSLSLDPPTASIVVGRLRTCALVLTDALASRQHFHISRHDSRYVIADLQSHNGTYVNGEKIAAERILRSGDELRLGSSRLVFWMTREADEAPGDQETETGKHILRPPRMTPR